MNKVINLFKENDKSKTFCHTACVPIQCFALNSNGNRVIVAGKNGNLTNKAITKTR